MKIPGLEMNEFVRATGARFFGVNWVFPAGRETGEPWIYDGAEPVMPWLFALARENPGAVVFASWTGAGRWLREGIAGAWDCGGSSWFPARPESPGTPDAEVAFSFLRERVARGGIAVLDWWRGFFMFPRGTENSLVFAVREWCVKNQIALFAGADFEPLPGGSAGFTVAIPSRDARGREKTRFTDEKHYYCCE